MIIYKIFKEKCRVKLADFMESTLNIIECFTVQENKKAE